MPHTRTLIRFVLLMGTLAGGAAGVGAQTSFMRIAPDLYFYYTGGGANSIVLITKERQSRAGSAPTRPPVP